MGRSEEEAEPDWELIVVTTLLATLRREREWRYSFAGQGIFLKRTMV